MKSEWELIYIAAIVWKKNNFYISKYKQNRWKRKGLREQFANSFGKFQRSALALHYFELGLKWKKSMKLAKAAKRIQRSKIGGKSIFSLNV